MQNEPFDIVTMVEELCCPPRRTFGPLTDGKYIQVGGGMGFYVPPEAYAQAKALANETRKVQFLSVDVDGNPIHGTREECLDRGHGGVAWVLPD